MPWEKGRLSVVIALKIPVHFCELVVIPIDKVFKYQVAGSEESLPVNCLVLRV